MKVVFVTNYYNHHQTAFSHAMYEKLGGEFAFVETETVSSERLALGYRSRYDEPFLYHYTTQKEVCDDLIKTADAVIFGMAPAALVRAAIRRNQLILRYSERPLKDGAEWHKYLPRLLKWHKLYPQSKSVYLLAAGAYTAKEYRRFGLYRRRAYTWGYFPHTYRYDSVSRLMEAKDRASLLWCGRFLDWKHPDDAVTVASRLKKEGYDFTLTLIGTGEMENVLRRRIAEEGLEQKVHMIGAVDAERVRAYMEHAGIFLMTSDGKEGWGVVLNEAMNSGCAVVASHAAGAAPILIDQANNGYLYPSENTEKLYECVKHLLDHPSKQQRMGIAAYQTVTQHWNAETAAERLVSLMRQMLEGHVCPTPYNGGICSLAPLLSEKKSKPADICDR